MPEKAWARLDLPASDVAQFNQVLSSTEALLASTRDDSYAQVRFAVKPVEDLAHFQMTREGDAVHLLLAVDSDEQDIIGWVREYDVRRGWGSCLGLDRGHGA